MLQKYTIIRTTTVKNNAFFRLLANHRKKLLLFATKTVILYTQKQTKAWDP